MKIAAIDVGTNSFHLIVVKISEDGSFEIIERAREMVRLGDRTLVEGVIPPESFDKAAEALRKMKQIAERHRCDEVLAYATSAVREAHNGGAFARAMRDETGISLHVIRGDEEGRLIYLGARQRLNIKGRYLIADIGGGSVEIVLADQKEIYFVASVKLGVLRLSQVAVNSDPISAEDRARLLERLHHTLDGIAGEVRGMGFSQFVLTSGTAHSLAQLASMREANQPISTIHGAKLSFNSLYALERELFVRIHGLKRITTASDLSSDDDYLGMRNPSSGTSSPSSRPSSARCTAFTGRSRSSSSRSSRSRTPAW